MQVILILMAALVGFVLLAHTLFQSNIAFFLFPTGLADNSVPMAKLVRLLDEGANESVEAAIDVYAGAQRFAGVVSAFPEGAQPSESLRRLLESHAVAGEVLAARDIRFRTLTASEVDNSPLRGSSLIELAVLEVSVALNTGEVAYFWLTPSAVMYNRHFGMLPMFVFLMLAVALVGVLLVRLAFRPLKSLERAASDFDGFMAPEPILEVGPSEVKQVARSLNEMQSRIHTLIQERALIIAAIAHDVRSALARLKLRLDGREMVDPGIEEDLNQVSVMMDDMVTFARPAPSATVDPEIVVLDVWLTNYAHNSPYQVCWQGDRFRCAVIAIHERALRRALDNLVDNANRYAGSASLSLSESVHGWDIQVRDRGPGIPEDEISRLFTPFHRLEYSRNRRTGGSGLGLGIARELIRGEGGDVTLKNAADGGLIATIHLPDELQVAGD